MPLLSPPTSSLLPICTRWLVLAQLVIVAVAFSSVTLASNVAPPGVWIYLDARGVKTYSDTAPPVNIPEKNILQRPGDRARAGASAASSPASGWVAGDKAAAAPSSPAAAGSSAARSPRITGKDPELERKLKAKADEENAKKLAEAASAKAQEESDRAKRKASCDAQIQNRTALKSDNRIARVNAKGEREFLSDEQRAAELRQVESNLAECAKG